jgi:hypothetical protein
MNRLAVLASLACLSIPAAVRSEAVDCVPDFGCPKDESPPECCKPPPCEVFDELRFWRSMKKFFQLETIGFAMKESGLDQTKAESLYDSLIKFTVNEPLQMYTCDPESGRRPDILKYEVTKDCQIGIYQGGSFVPVSRNEFLDYEDTCSEIVEAKYSRVEAQRDWCLKEQTSGGWFDQMLKERVGISAEIGRLEDELLHYAGVCSIVFDAEIPRIVAEQGVDALFDNEAAMKSLKQGPQAPPPSAPKRAARSTRSRTHHE